MVMHVGVILGAFLIVALRQPEIGLVLLVALKTAFDLWGHQNEREKISQTKSPSLVTFTAPQAPALQSLLQARMQAGAGQKIFPTGLVVIILLLIFCAGFISFVLYGFIGPLFNNPHLHPNHSSPPVAVTWGPPEWKPKLTGVLFPETPAYGKLRGAGFSVAFAVYADQKLSLSDGGGPGSRAVIITLNQSPNRLAGTSYDIWSDRVAGALPIEMISRGDNSETTVSRVFTGGYALKLKFGNRVKNKIPMKIYLCLPDTDKSYLGGTFDVTIEKAKKRASSGKSRPEN
jgi:hypothetical protein